MILQSPEPSGSLRLFVPDDVLANPGAEPALLLLLLLLLLLRRGSVSSCVSLTMDSLRRVA